MNFPSGEFMDEVTCYTKLVAVLHPDGLVCPRWRSAGELKVHRRHHVQVLDYRCDICGYVFNAFTGSELYKTRRRPSEIILILRGVARTTSTARLSRELNRHRPHFLRLRHHLQALVPLTAIKNRNSRPCQLSS
jgi:transposase-like protein